MVLTNIIGDVGSGKTLILAMILSESEVPVYANFHLYFDRVRNITLDFYPEFTLLTPEMLNTLNTGSSVGIDEAYTWLESRVSGSKAMNMYLSYIVFQARKKNMGLYTTSQLIESLDIRYRLMANYELYCENVDEGFKYEFKKISRYHNYHPIVFTIPYEVAESYYQIYDTNELLNPIDDNMLFDISKDKAPMLEEIDSIVDVLLKKNAANKYTKGMIEVWCLKQKPPIPKKMADRIYNAMKAKSIGL
jgi:hypothetical protein